MSVISNNQGPVNAETSMVGTSDINILQNIYLELKVLNVILKQAFSITDEDAGIRNSLVVSDLTHIA
jgi:hypothetical protein